MEENQKEELHEVNDQIQAESSEIGEQLAQSLKTDKQIKARFLNKKILIVLGVAIVVGGLFVKTWNDPVDKLSRALSSKSEDKIEEIYDLYIEGDSELESIVWRHLSNDLVEIKESYLNGKLSFEEVMNELELYRKIGVIEAKTNSIKNSIIDLHDSQKAFNLGNEFLKKGEIESAVESFKEVISADEQNYENAQEQLLMLKEEYLKDTLSSVEKLMKKENYGEVITQLEKALKLYPKESELTVQKTKAESLLREQREKEEAKKIEEMKNNQKLTVTKAYAVDSSIYNEGYVVVKNNTNQVVKSYVVGMLMFDKNGYPVNNRYSNLYGEGNLKKGNADTPNIQPGETYGRNAYWNIEDNAIKIKACVIEAEFYDGTSWTNPYFEYWYEAEKDRY